MHQNAKNILNRKRILKRSLQNVVNILEVNVSSNVDPGMRYAIICIGKRHCVAALGRF